MGSIRNIILSCLLCQAEMAYVTVQCQFVFLLYFLLARVMTPKDTVYNKEECTKPTKMTDRLVFGLGKIASYM